VWCHQVKEEGWWLVLGDVNTHELLALKRISFADHTTARLTFPVANGAGKEMAGVTLFFMSDSYLGLDQQYFVPVVAKQQGNQQRHGQTGQQHSHQQQRHAHNGPQQKPAAATETAGVELNGQNADDDAAGITSAVGQMDIGEAGRQRMEPDNSTSDLAAGQEAKQQRPNARRRRG
jgi:hypothetical protein